MRLHPRGRGQGQVRASVPRKDEQRSGEGDLEAVPLWAGMAPGTDGEKRLPSPASPLGNPVQLATRRRHPPFLVSMCALLLVAAGVLSITSFISPSSNTSSTSSSFEHSFENFITIRNGSFMDGSKPFFVVGVNIDTIVEGAIKSVYSRPVAASRANSRDMIKSLFKSAATSKLNVIRTWAHTTDASHPLQQRPKVYSEDVFQALDYVIAEAGAVGLRIILSFVDTWRYRGGVAEFVDWSPTAPPRDPAYPPLIIEGDVTPDSMTKEREEYESSRKARFFSDPGSKELYKSHVATILNRRNTFTKKRYVDDPTIFAFNLINEPRCDLNVVARCPDLVQDWTQEMAAYFRSLDQNHLLTVGEEGFWGRGDPRTPFNPGAAGGGSWASETGQDFVRNHATEGISFASIHAWTDNWNATDVEFMDHWLEEHAKDAARLGKPLLLEEFGKKMTIHPPATVQQISQVKDPVFLSIYKSIERSLANGGPLQGSLAWEMAFQIYEESPPSPYGINVGDSTFQVMKAHALRVWAHSIRLARRSEGTSMGEDQQECWVPSPSMFGSWWRSCRPDSDACAISFDDEDGLSPTLVSVFESKEACCRPVTGAFERGCTSRFM